MADAMAAGGTVRRVRFSRLPAFTLSITFYPGRTGECEMLRRYCPAAVSPLRWSGQEMVIAACLIFRIRYEYSSFSAIPTRMASPRYRSLQQALDELAEAGGGTLVVDHGRYALGGGDRVKYLPVAVAGRQADRQRKRR